MENLDELLLKIYMIGFTDLSNRSELFKKAYEIGRNHCILGDDVRSSDYFTNEEILELIHNKNQ